jgi:PAS domain S-box-containing protein
MNENIFVGLINNAAMLLSLGLIYDILSREKRTTVPVLNQLTSGVIIGGMAILLMLTPVKWESGIIFDTRTILLGLTGLFFGTIPTLLAVSIAGAYRFSLGGGGAIAGVATIISSGLIGLAWRHFRFRVSNELSLPELYLFGGVVHTVMMLCMFLLPQTLILKTISAIVLPVIIIYPICTALLGKVLAGRQRRHCIEEELQDSKNKLQEQNEELQLNEEELRDQNDHLLATEEMLRVQIDDYEESQKLLKESEELSRTNAQLLQSVIEHFPGVIFWKNTESTYLGCNKAFSDGAGLTDRTEIVGKSDYDMPWAETEASNYRDIDRDVIDSAEAKLHIIETQHQADGHTAWFDTSKVPLRDNQGKIWGVLGASFDITERKLAEEQLRHTKKMDVLGQLAGGVAHDFNNMLTGIMSAAELLKFRLSDEDRNMKLVDTILNAAARSAELTRDLLAFSRKGKSENIPVAIDDMIAEVIGLLERTIDKRINLITRLDAENHTVIGDSTLLQNALLNLGVNARDAMPEGGTITYSTSVVALADAYCKYNQGSITPGMFLQITVSDTGVGIPKEIIDRIYEPFFTTKETGKGTGLGLSAVYGTVRDHHGSINVYSEPGQGTVFNVFIPLSSAESVIVEEKEGIIHGTGGILIVDDEEMIRSMGHDLLTELGYTVFLAEDGYQALGLYALHRDAISLVILDIIMPKMNGKETYLKLREIDPDVRVLLCSGFHREGTTQELIEFGAKGFIKKPYNMIDLSRAVMEGIRG